MVDPAGEPSGAAGRAAAAATVVSATLAASHCLAPVAFALFGTTLGAVAALSVLARYQPYFVTAGLACWSYGFYRLYVQTSSANPPRPLARARRLLWLGFAGLLVAIALPRLVGYLAG